MTPRTFNLIFDLGGVVLDWQPDLLIARVFQDPKDQAKARKGIIGHQDWLELDRGTLEPEKAITNAAARTGLAEDSVRTFLAMVPPALKPVEETLDLLRRLQSRGHPLYCLSNMHLASIAYLEKQYSFWNLFDGVVISSYVKLIKPERAIYQLLLDKYQLDPTRTIFIDDVRENLEAAAALGIRTIQFTTAADCEKQLQKWLQA